jgi:phenylpyruvate tautomerase PptA (4-oxalocrotonate tautomerase family)
MPMIDVYAPASLFPAGAEEALAQKLTLAVLRAEGVAQPGPLHLAHTAAFLHRLPEAAVGTAARQPDRAVRVQVVTPPHALSREGQRQLTAEATRIVAEAAGDAGLAARTWVILTEAAEGGWGIAGQALGKEEFAALKAKPAGK